MPAAAPLQVLIFRHPDDRELTAFEGAIIAGIQGGKDVGPYLAAGEDFGIQTKIFDAPPPMGPDQTLDSFGHTFVAVLVDEAFLTRMPDALWDWLANAWQHIDASRGRHGIIVLTMEERQVRRVTAKRATLGNLQMRPAHTYGETAIRPAMVALLVMHKCRELLAAGLPHVGVAGKPVGFLRLFISHAKVDGLPLAQALHHLIHTTPWLDGYYDVDDLPEGNNWQRELERGVGSSVIIMLRTNLYEERHWCQREVIWADEYATPAVLVDARTGMNYPAATLPFDRVPVVRIPDGNLLRILNVALREGLRFLHFVGRVEQMKTDGELPDPVELKVFSFPPSMPALLRACRSFTNAAGIPKIILYPDPVFRTGHFEAALALVGASAPAGVRLVTPNTLAATAAP
jgi:hypothetical protein